MDCFTVKFIERETFSFVCPAFICIFKAGHHTDLFQLVYLKTHLFIFVCRCLQYVYSMAHCWYRWDHDEVLSFCLLRGQKSTGDFLPWDGGDNIFSAFVFFFFTSQGFQRQSDLRRKFTIFCSPGFGHASLSSASCSQQGKEQPLFAGLLITMEGLNGQTIDATAAVSETVGRIKTAVQTPDPPLTSSEHVSINH